MFIAILLIITLNWKLLKRVSITDWTNKQWHVHLMVTLGSNKRETTTDICNDTNESQKHC